MTNALIALIIAALEVAEIWTGWSPGIDAKWLETLLMLLLPVFIWITPPGGWPWGKPNHS